MKIRIALFAVLALLAAAAACKKSGTSSGAYSTTNGFKVGGTWNGNYSMTNNSISTATLVLSQVGSNVTGNFTSSRGTGTVTGSVVSSSFTFTLSIVSTCSWNLYSEGARVTDSSFTVTYAHAVDLICLGAEDVGTGSFHK